MKILARFIEILVCILIVISGHRSLEAQILVDSVGQDSVIQIEIVSPTDSSVFKIENGQEVQELYGNVVVKHDSLFVRCDVAIVRNKQNLSAYGHVVLTKPDSIFVFADSINYDSRTGIADLYSDKVVLENKDLRLVAFKSFTLDTRSNIGYYQNSGFILSDSSQIESKRGIYDFSTKMASMKDSVKMQSREFRLATDSLNYDVPGDKVFFIAPTRMQEGSRSIYCEGGYFEQTTRQALFHSSVQFIDGQKEGLADTMRFDGNTDITILKGNATVVDSSVTAAGERIVYDDRAQTIRLQDKAKLVNVEGTVFSDDMMYDMKSDKLTTYREATVENEDFDLRAQSLDFDNKRGVSVASDGVRWYDKKNNNLLFSEHLYLIEDQEYVHASGSERPLLIAINEGDSTYIRSDSLIRRQVDGVFRDDTNYSELRAFYNVEIFGPGYRAICDSLYYSEIDSIFHLLGSPVVWSDSAQIFGDTIRFLLKNGAIERAEVVQRASIMSYTSHATFWNQIQGKTMDVYFLHNKIDRVFVDINAESMYFVEEDDGRLNGCNHVLCASMTIKFREQQIDRIKFGGRSDGNFLNINPTQSGKEFRLKLSKDLFHLRPLPSIKQHFAQALFQELRHPE